MAVLLHLAPDGTGRILQSYPLADQALIGRGEDAQIPLHDPSISRQHARIVRTARGWELFEVASTNGVLVWGQRVAHHVLRPGDCFTLGNVLLRFELTDPRQQGTVALPVAAFQPAPQQPPQPALAFQHTAPALQQPAPAYQRPAPAYQQPAPAFQQPAPAQPQAGGRPRRPGRNWGLALFLVVLGLCACVGWLQLSGWLDDYSEVIDDAL